MPRRAEPSFSMKLLIWDAAASAGKVNLSAICREVDHQMRKLRRTDEHLEDERPDNRTVRRIIDQDIQELSADVVVAKLPPHTWCLRNDYEAIKQLWEETKAQRETSNELRADPATSLRICLREIGGNTGDSEGHKGGQLVAFTLGNLSDNILTVERIGLEVMRCQPYLQPQRIEARVMPLRYEVKLSPDALGEYVITEETFRYAGRGADDFDLVCDSPPGHKYNLSLKIYYSDLLTNRHFTLSSTAFDIYFCKEGDLLSGYRARGYDKDTIADLQRRKPSSTDNAWL